MTAESLASRIQGPVVHFVPEFGAAVQLVSTEVREGDLILTLGAGSVSQLAPQILAALETIHSEVSAKYGKISLFPCFLE